MVVPPIFTTDIPAGPNRELSVSRGPYNDEAMFLIWRCILLSPNVVYMFLHCLKETYALVQHHTHHILQNL